ncbi:hypothetical protein ABB37_07738 [Leptomonas pyrrhocoris]|uniref:Uncharacterized protein n=1 Tax=Leptomonas pyrrhocoris TaxID=157538 RepID=A0A0N0VDW4_LEPPY|nr:hypothetical protein ABB37_07738 [Leptomonas pyrrhocoris]KPA76401.1 hypothetical protein ABB37_07738 [Leptomonas pyrrhocoris]|eukprot:XP_015654840.1 hypothetical protein ABB37_07738 [Leptomonas pyrrhocoris]
MYGLEQKLLEVTNARTANVRHVNPLSWYDPFLSWFRSNFDSTVNNGIQTALQKLIEIGVPIAARSMINTMSYKLGNSQLPVDTTFAKSSGWAIALIVVLSVVCAAVVALVAFCIWWERRLEKRKTRTARKAAATNWNEEDEEEHPRVQSLSNSRGSRSSDDDFDDDDDDDDDDARTSSFVSGSDSSESDSASDGDEDTGEVEVLTRQTLN